VDFSKEGEMLLMQMRNPGDVPQEICEHFFEKYATWGKTEGTGLGTYSARLAVEIQGGRIAMHSREGVTTLDVWLPAV
jgi:signal transduction histidine kinase